MKYSDEIERLFPDSDEEWEKMVGSMNDAELIAYLRNVTEALAHDPAASAVVPPDVVEDLKTNTDKYQTTVRDVEIAEQNAALARAALERTADAILTSFPDKTRGH